MQEFLKLLDKGKVVLGLAPITPSTSTPDYVNLKGYQKCSVIIVYDNATSVTGSDITLKQATAVAGTSEKALGFETQYANTDISANDTLTETDVTSDTFTTDDTDNKNGIHVIEVDADDLDRDNNFDCLRAGTGDAANTVLAVIYILHGPRYAPTLDRSAITD